VAATLDPRTDDLAILRAAVELLDAFDYLLPLEPFAGECPRCHEGVCVVRLDGLDVVLELAEVMEAHACPDVAARGKTKRQRCWRCWNTGVVGEPLPMAGVAVSEHGDARAWGGGARREGEAVHRPHFCT
jgi:hypothetical protein